MPEANRPIKSKVELISNTITKRIKRLYLKLCLNCRNFCFNVFVTPWTIISFMIT